MQQPKTIYSTGTCANTLRYKWSKITSQHTSRCTQFGNNLRTYMSLKLMCSLLALGLSACSQQAPTTDAVDTNQATNQKTSNQANSQAQTANAADLPNAGNTYTVITVPDFMPFVYREADGHIAGFDIDVMNAIADARGFSVDIITMPREKLFDSLSDGQYDIIAAAISVTEERKENMDFSDAYFHSQKTVLLNNQLPQIKSFQDLTKYKIGAQRKTTSEEILKEIFIESPENIKYVDTAFLGVRSVISGQLDGVMSDLGIMYHYYKENPHSSLQIFSDPSYPTEDYAFVVNKGRDDGLIKEINLGLKTIQSDGTYKKIIKNWFGRTMAENTMAKN